MQIRSQIGGLREKRLDCDADADRHQKRESIGCDQGERGTQWFSIRDSRGGKGTAQRCAGAHIASSFQGIT
jgi:hypothetical protein